MKKRRRTGEPINPTTVALYNETRNLLPPTFQRPLFLNKFHKDATDCQKNILHGCQLW